MREVRTGNPPTAMRSLPIEAWPTADMAAWEEACRPNVRLKRGGAASHMRPVTQRDLAKRYGLFLDSLFRAGRFDEKARAGTQVTPDSVDGYVTELKSRVHAVTVYGSIQKLRRIVQLIAPDLVLDWLIVVERKLGSEMRPSSKWDRVVYANILIDAGLTLMAEAEIAKRPKLTRARMFRNGFMIALLGYCPIRLKNFAALAIGRSFVNVDGLWWILLQPLPRGEERGQRPRISNHGRERGATRVASLETAGKPASRKRKSALSPSKPLCRGRPVHSPNT
jgi:hypothetical protein